MNQEEKREQMPENFDQAQDATRVLFEDSEQENTPVQGEEMQGDTEQADAEAQLAQQEAETAEQAVQTAEAAAGLAQEKDAQLQQMSQELQTMREQNAQLMDAISQMSQVQAENLTDEALAPPVLDLERLVYEDSDTIRQSQAEYAQQMADYIMQKMSRTMEPLVKQAEQGKAQRERAEAITALEQVPELPGFREMLPQIENIIEHNSLLSGDNVPIDEKYVTAYAIARGIDSMNHPKTDPTASELMDFYEKNPEFQELLEKKRLEQIKDRPTFPPLSASSGGVSAALNIAEKPKNFEEAAERTRRMFGL